MATPELLSLEEFTALVREHQAALRAFIRMLGIAPDLVDDIAQETFLTAFRRLETFQKGTYFQAWVRSIARNVIANERRKDARRSRLVNAQILEVLERDEPAEDARLSGDMVAAMKGCIEELPSNSRAMLEARYGRGENSTAIADQFSRSAVAIRQALMKIRAALQKCLELRIGKVQA